MTIARTIGIWISGLLACAAVGGAIAHMIYSFGDDIGGSFAGALAFTCIRLWFKERI